MRVPQSLISGHDPMQRPGPLAFRRWVMPLAMALVGAGFMVSLGCGDMLSADQGYRRSRQRPPATAPHPSPDKPGAAALNE